MNHFPRTALVKGQAGLAAAAVVSCASDDGEVVRAAGLPSGHGAALGRVVEGLVALAGVVGAVGGEGTGHVVVDGGGVLVVTGAEGGRVGHLHMGLGYGGEQGQGYNLEEVMHGVWY